MEWFIMFAFLVITLTLRVFCVLPSGSSLMIAITSSPKSRKHANEKWNESAVFLILRTRPRGFWPDIIPRAWYRLWPEQNGCVKLSILILLITWCSSFTQYLKNVVECLKSEDPFTYWCETLFCFTVIRWWSLSCSVTFFSHCFVVIRHSTDDAASDQCFICYSLSEYELSATILQIAICLLIAFNREWQSIVSLLRHKACPAHVYSLPLICVRPASLVLCVVVNFDVKSNDACYLFFLFGRKSETTWIYAKDLFTYSCGPRFFVVVVVAALLATFLGNVFF